MIAYCGQTRAAALVRALEALGVGECTSRGELGPRRSRWFYDNGAFADWQAGRPFGLAEFVADCRSIRRGGRGARRWGSAPDFLVLPDVVAGGAESLALSLAWARGEWFELPAVPLYLAVQDGMTGEQVADAIAGSTVAGLFVGGSLPWKLRTGAEWCELGRRLGLPVHVGRVGTVERVEWAREIGASSIDSALPLWSADKLGAWAAALAGSVNCQGRLL